MNGFFGLVRIFLRIEKKVNQIFDVLHLLAAFLRDRENASPVIWLDNQDVMQILKISERTLRRRRMEGTIPSTRMGGKFLYKKSDIKALLGHGINEVQESMPVKI